MTSSSSKPRLYAPGVERTAAIIDAATRLFAERGYRAVSLREIAAASNTSHSSVIRYFGSKETLLQEVLARRDAAVEKAVQNDGAGGIAESIAAATRRNHAEPEMVATFVSAAAEAAQKHHPAHTHYRERYEAARQSLAAALERAYGSDGFAGGFSAAEVAILLFAVEDGLQLQWLYSPDDVDILGLTERITSLLLSRAD